MKKKYVATVNLLIEVDDDELPESDMEEIDNQVLAWLDDTRMVERNSFKIKMFELEDVIPETEFAWKSEE